MTMHSSKGLEFPIVYILDANEGITPHRKAVLEADLEEERRMFLCGHDPGQGPAVRLLCAGALRQETAAVPVYRRVSGAAGRRIRGEADRGKEPEDMEQGLIHIYCGDGKGKSTAAAGLAARAAGRGKQVLVARFLKTDDSER